MFNILAPIFGLIALAYAARKINILGPSAYVELNRCVASLALPALIFDNVAHVTPSHLNQPGFAASFGEGWDAQLLVILSALSTGTGAIMLADVYKRDLEVTSTAAMVSTILSALSLSLCLTIVSRIL